MKKTFRKLRKVFFIQTERFLVASRAYLQYLELLQIQINCLYIGHFLLGLSFFVKGDAARYPLISYSSKLLQNSARVTRIGFADGGD